MVKIAEIPEQGLVLSYRQAALDLGAPCGLWSSPASVEALISLTKTAGSIRAYGSFSATVALICSRCAEPFSFSTEDRFDVCFQATPPAEMGEDYEVTLEELNVEFLEGQEIDVDNLVRESVLLALPVKPLCREDCLGLCPRCGNRLSDGFCGCLPLQRAPQRLILRS
jgi:uncharacterized protein